MHVRLIRKLAEVVDGVDLSGRVVGDLLDLAPDQADLLVAEGWGEAVPDGTDVAETTTRLPLATAADAPPRRRRARR
jgi:hypothetical protein